LVNARKKNGWHGSLTLPLDRGDDKERQTNRIQAQCTWTALQSHSAAFSLQTSVQLKRQLIRKLEIK
jgi:hypothetical protein